MQVVGSLIDFNPRSREGSDGQTFIDIIHSSISIHAPVKGATQPRGVEARLLQHFNPRSREGSDIFCAQALSLTALFQSTLP